MKYTIFAIAFSLLPNLADAADNLTDDRALGKYKPYATYFGFSDTKTYLEFANKLEMLVAGSLTAGLSVYEDPEYLSIQGIPSSSLSDDQRTQLENMVKARRQQLASLLGVEEKDMYSKINEYLKYRDLTISLLESKQLNVGGVQAMSDEEEEDDDIEVIKITAKKLNEMGGYGSFQMSLELGYMALDLGLPQYTVFKVVFESRGTQQKYKYNNFSGAWPIENEKQIDKSCPTCDSPIILQ